MDVMGPCRRVLVVDDDHVVADSLGMILSGSCYEVRVAHSAESASRLISQWTPEVAIVDVLLPGGMGGIDFAIFLQTACPGCQVLLFTALPGVSGALEAAKVDAHDFQVMEKPIPPADMLDRVAALLAALPQKSARPPVA